MTVTYTAEVATCRGFGCFIPLLARWRASVYKLVWMDLVAYLAIYYFLNIIYVYILAPDQKKIFENIVQYCIWHGDRIPISFVLGFYVSIVVKRWWDQYLSIPWPDAVAVFVAAHIRGSDERPRLIRRTIMRYVCSCLAIALAHLSPRVKKRFPTWDHYVPAGFLQENEKNIIHAVDQKSIAYPKHWMPIVWSASIAARARKEGLIRDDCAMNSIVTELNIFRGTCGKLMHYDFISVPLVYTQVVTLAVYSYFLCALMAKQPLDNSTSLNNTTLYHYPIFSLLEFFFYMGWLKVAETLICPFGEDDDDFEVNWLLDRHLLVSYLIVDEMHEEHPDLVRDAYWDQVFPDIPYGDIGVKREDHPEPSTAKIGKLRSDSKMAIRDRTRKSVTGLEAESESQFSLPLIFDEYNYKTVSSTFIDVNTSQDSLGLASISSSDYFEQLKIERQNERLKRWVKVRKSYEADLVQTEASPEASPEAPSMDQEKSADDGESILEWGKEAVMPIATIQRTEGIEDEPFLKQEISEEKAEGEKEGEEEDVEEEAIEESDFFSVKSQD